MQAVTQYTGATPDIEAFRASGGLAAILINDPKAVWYFLLADRGRSVASGGRGAQLRLVGNSLNRGSPSDVLGVASDGTVLLLDSLKGRVVSDNIGGYRSVVTEYRLPATVRRGCALEENTYVFHDAARAGLVSIRRSSATDSQSELVIQTALDDADASGWDEARLSGTMGRSCVLWSPKRTNGFLISESAASPMNLHDLSEDIASCPRGLAAIPKGKTHARRVVRFFSASGQPTGVMRFDRSILRIGCTDHRLIVLAGTNDSTYLASYVLPIRLRDSTLAAEPTVIAPPSPINRRDH